jgi:hypothetical protein
MRDPASPEGPKVPETASASGTGVSIPDRRRIDSDVRAFLREPSTPWIVFDQEGRPPSQLAVGEILKGPRRTLLSDYDFFPATAAVDRAPSPSSPSSPSKIVEPSSLAVASDLAALRASSSAQFDAVAREASAIPMFGLSRRVLGASAAAFALLSMLAVGTLALRSASHDGAEFRNVAVAQPATRPDPRATVPAETPPPDLDVKAPVYESQPAVAPAPAPAAPAPAAVTLSVVPAHNDASAKSGANKYGRLTITGDARSKDVFMDGKRMLGRGARSFSVMCGPHTIAVSVRSDAHDVDIPCNAELVVGK